ncbi:diguanylate cyclase domain-containing protein [Natranaerobius thermophilus]|uniref:Diguanylate cyclase and metal dependent phosphohydrolase n=1 Tax=Natranaerobius thermophilus (strain ATCC BAA-1301 / DSM 18059 / JW/NM-WN-LF) TaxID=457570 RepID=B2A0U3_NATTJ|nr:HD domain-containing phosphohydrolase [Natranaerobius thermophilus]ACB85973.1 diguanylate cyclase and metal dependent phosphohydrolase [Natranaerobius thermophilus JW/NM-WN-LF]
MAKGSKQYQVMSQYLKISEKVLIVLDLNGIIEFVNDKGCQLLELKEEQLLGKSFFKEFLSLEENLRFLQVFNEVLAQENNEFYKDIDLYVMPAIGTPRLFSTRLGLYRDDSGEITGVIIAGESISECESNSKVLNKKEKIEQVLGSSEEKFRKLANNIPGIIYLCQNEDDYPMIYLNDNIEEITGFSKQEFLEGNRNFRSIIHKEDLPQVKNKINSALLDNKPFHLIYRIFDARGEMRWFEERGVAINGGGRNHYLEGFIHDITARKEAEEQIRYLSFYDELTGLYNRRFFKEELYRLNTNRQLPMSLILGDVNGLKLVNDAFGHLEGDRLLIKAAETIKKSCRSEDIIARFGGDEFIVLLPQTKAKEAELVSQRIVDNMREQEFKKFNLSISLGLATKEIEEEDKNTETLIREAEERMYQKKIADSKKVRSEIIESLLKILREKSFETEMHGKRLRLLSRKMGKALKLPDSELQKLSHLSVLHDVGKVTIGEKILKKKEPLTDKEWEIIKRHPEDGFKIALAAPELAPIAEAILHHHERWDGNGYPQGLSGDNIPLLSRIISIVDAYDVMIRGRSYKEPMGKEKALWEILRCGGRQFDPQLAKLFVEIIQDQSQGVHTPSIH